MKKQEKTPSRRGLIFGAAAAGAAASVLVALPKPAPEQPAPEVLAPTPEKGGGYTLSAHVKHYYRTTLI